MKITFFGGAGQVTGSSSLFEATGKKFLVDCGMFQGGAAQDAQNRDPLPFNPAELTAAFVTHAHLDHVGRLPLLTKNGFTGHIYATKPTVDLAKLIMEDALEVMIYNNRKFQTAILYDSTDIANAMDRFVGVEYGEPVVVSGGVSATFHDVGHIFGSAFIEVLAEGKRVVFSGDVGNVEVPILRDTEQLPADIDALVCESTYGNRLHPSVHERQALIERHVHDAIARGGVVMIPSFSLERTQELIYELNELVDRKHTLPRIPIFLDSPLAIDALKVYQKYPQYYDAEAAKYFNAGDDLFNFPGLTLTYTRAESMKINHVPGQKIIIAGAGMMNGGRIVHHALRYLSDPKSTLLVIGYQSIGTLGRDITDGVSPVTVLGERVEVHCHVEVLGALSAHGDQAKLLHWIGAAPTKPKKVFLNHGDPAASEALAAKLLNDLQVTAAVAKSGVSVEV